jgi:hypothetical protein
MRDAGAGALRWRALAFHVLSAAHGVADFAGKSLLFSSEGVEIGKYC